MNKIKKLFLLREAKEIVTLIFDKGKFQILGEDGLSKEYSEKEISDLFDKLKIDSSHIKKAKTSRDNQTDIKIDSKEINKLNLR